MKWRLLIVACGIGALVVAVALLIFRLGRPAAPRPHASDPPPEIAAAEFPAAALTPARIPHDSETDAVFPDGSGDWAVIDSDGGRVVRTGPGGEVRWATPLAGHVGGVRWPHVVADTDRAYVRNARGVTVLDARTGKVAWRSPGPEDRLLLSGDLLLAADCCCWDDVERTGRWLVAWRATTGEEAFRVALPVKDFDPLPIKENAGLFLVQDNDSPGGRGAALLIDRAGRVFHRFDRQVVAVAACGDDRVVVTSRDVVRLGADGRVLWTTPFPTRCWIAGGGLVLLPAGDMVAYLYGRISDGGVQVMRLDLASGQKVWEVWCLGLGVGHSKYHQDAQAALEGHKLVVTSRGSSGIFVEALDVETGKSFGRWVSRGIKD